MSKKLKKIRKVAKRTIGKLADSSYSHYRKLKKSVKYHSGGGKYGERQNVRTKKQLERALKNEGNDKRREAIKRMLRKYK